MFRLVLGRSKSGKTEYVRNYLSSLAMQGENKLLMIVPDQQTFDTEKAFLELLGAKDALNVKVLGFSRLCDFIFENTGYTPLTLADDSVRSLVMSMALEDTSDLLRIYGERALSPDLLSMMLSVHKEFTRGKVTSEVLRNTDMQDNTILRDKLYDTDLVLSAYDSLLSSSFEDADGELSIACDLLSKNSVFKDYYICVDSYLSFTELEIDILKTLMSQCKELLITLSDDKKDSEDTFFDISKSTAKRLLSIAKESGVKVHTPIMCEFDEYFNSPVLSYIEKNIFTYSEDKIELNPDEESAISLYCAQNVYEESDFVARKIRELVLTKGYKYSDIAVVLRDVSPYFSVLDTALDKYDVSYFMDTPSVIHSKPLIKLISACFDCVTTSFDKDNVLALLKSGLICRDIEEIAAFENYIFTWGISGTGFYKEFTANPRGFCDEFKAQDLSELSKIESLRKFMIEPLLEFRKNIKDATGETICKELYNLLITLGVDENIKALCDEFDSASKPQFSEELVRLWQMFTETLDRTIAVIGNRKIAVKRFSQLLSLQFAAQDMSFIPRAIDQVTVGDIERLRLSNKKIVFLMGAVEGQFPKITGDSGIFTSVERELLSEAGILSDTSPDSDYLREQYLAYYALTSASDKLFVSYPVSDLKSAENVHSEIVSSLKSLFKNIEEVKFCDVPLMDRLWAPDPSFSTYAGRLRNEDSITKALEQYFSENDEYKSALRSLKNAVKANSMRIENPAVSEKLFGNNMYLSPSKVEKYHKCRFAYFCEYGLRLGERKRAAIDSLEYGTFVHYILEHFLLKYTKNELLSLSEDDIISFTDSISKEYADTHFGGLEDKTPRFKYLFNKIVTNTHKIVRHLVDEIIQSSFTPKVLELNIGEDIPAYKLTLPDGKTISISGKVDRADVMEKDGKKYIRIIDYKTGTVKFSLSNVMYGLNLQMLIYLSAIVKNGSEYFGGELIPAGALYMPAALPVVKAEKDDDESTIVNKRYQDLRMNGLVLSDMDILEGMERDLHNNLFIPVGLFSKGSVKGKEYLATLEEMGAIFKKIDSIVGEMATELLEGNIEAKPILKNPSICSYCSYSALCKHKESDPYRFTGKLDRAEIREILGIKEEEATE